jgi:acetyl-CoA carboxylase biotin carboxyl carrier protein
LKRSTSKTAPKGAKKVSSVDINLVKDLTAFMKDNDLVELEVKQAGTEVRLRRGNANASVMQTIAPTYAAPVQAQAPATAQTANNGSGAAPAPEKKGHIVRSPFVGTFYRSAGPNQDAFVEEGKTVGVGDTLCIVEAMKLMNEIESDSKGRVVRVLVDNATPVEFGEPLFEIEPLR